MTITHTALTAQAEIRLICGLASSRQERPMLSGDPGQHPTFGEDHRAGRSQLALPVLLLEPSDRRTLAEVLACGIFWHPCRRG